MPLQSHYIFLIIILSFATEALGTRHCHRRANRLLFSDLVDETPDDGQKVELPEDCGRSEVSLSRRQLHRIHAGYEAKPGQFPSYVQLFLPNIDSKSSYSTCGGTIITSRHILTAAHCTKGVDVEKTIVGSGLENLEIGPKSFESGVEKMCMSSKYNEEERQSRHALTRPLCVFDVAILKIKDDIVFSEEIQPACLPASPLAYDSQAYSIGLGLNYSIPSANNSTSPDKLQVLPALRVECVESMQHESIMCSRPNKPDNMGKVCQGDSGGPVLALDAEGRQTVYGLHSFGPAYCMAPPAELDEQLKDLHRTGYNADVYNIRDEIDRLLEECA